MYSITVGALSKDVPAGTSFSMTVDSASQNFKTAVHAQKDATKIYFNSDDGDVTGDLGTVSSTISAVGTGLDSLTPVDASKRSGDFPRFTAEFVLMARD